MPLKVATYLGLAVALFAVVFGAQLVIRTLLFGNPVAGYPSMMAVILFLGGVQLITLGVIGEYLGRVFNETKRRPLYLVERFVPSGIPSEHDRAAARRTGAVTGPRRAAAGLAELLRLDRPCGARGGTAGGAASWGQHHQLVPLSAEPGSCGDARLSRRRGDARICGARASPSCACRCSPRSSRARHAGRAGRCRSPGCCVTGWASSSRCIRSIGIWKPYPADRARLLATWRSLGAGTAAVRSAAHVPGGAERAGVPRRSARMGAAAARRAGEIRAILPTSTDRADRQ